MKKDDRWRRSWFHAIAAIILSCWACPSRATDYAWYADAQGGNDAWAGTSWPTAKKSVQAAINTAKTWLANNYSGTRNNMNPNDAIHIVVAPGTYTETLIPGANASMAGPSLAGSDTAAPLYIESRDWQTTGKFSTVILIPSTNNYAFFMRVQGGMTFGNWFVRGFTLREDNTGASGAVNKYGVYHDWVNSGTIENNVIELVNPSDSFGWTGIYGAKLAIRNNIIRKVGAHGGEIRGIAVAGGCTISNNLIYIYASHCSGLTALIRLYNGAHQNEISHNIVLSDQTANIDVGLGMPAYYDGPGNNSNNRVFANVFAHANRMIDAGTLSGNTCTNNVLFNNTFYHVGDTGYIQSYGSSQTFFDNMVVGGFVWGIYYEGALNAGTNVIDGAGNYLRAAMSFVTTSLPADFYNKLPNELLDCGWMQPIRGVSGVASRHGRSAAQSDVYGRRYENWPQIGGVSPPPPRGTFLCVR